MTLKQSHPAQTLMFGCNFLNGNTECHNSVQYVETEKSAVMFKAPSGRKKSSSSWLDKRIRAKRSVVETGNPVTSRKRSVLAAVS